MFNYSQISSQIIDSLPQRTKEVLIRRFGLDGKKGETLEAIGKDFNITRERVRQIERDGFIKAKEKTKEYKDVFKLFGEKIKSFGGIKREDLLLLSLSEKENHNYVYFLLNLDDSLCRFTDNKDFYNFWSIANELTEELKKAVEIFYQTIEREARPMSAEELESFFPTKEKTISYLEISKLIESNSEGFWGLNIWPEINPKGVKDKAYLVFKKQIKPLHFTEVAKLISDNTNYQTVHNELIKDERFILVGRGMYALKEWGYTPGEVKDIIIKVIKNSDKPLAQEEIIEKTLQERMVKKNTIVQNLSNKNHFLKNSDGTFTVKEA